MQKLHILNTREVKKLKEFIVENFGSFLKKDYVYLKNEKDKIFIINKDLTKIDLKKLRIDKIGLYFAESKNRQVRLSKEGAQLLHKEAREKLKNVALLDNIEMKKYFSGLDLEKDLGADSRFILLEYRENIIGCAKYKDKKIINFLPKVHRGEVIL